MYDNLMMICTIVQHAHMQTKQDRSEPVGFPKLSKRHTPDSNNNKKKKKNNSNNNNNNMFNNNTDIIIMQL